MAAGLCHATAGWTDPRISDPVQQDSRAPGSIIGRSSIRPVRSAPTRSVSHLSGRTDYQTNCAPCHTSQLHTRNSRSTDTLALLFREPGVNCEMCHGPSARHVALMAAGRHDAKAAAEPPIDFARLDSRQFVAICAQCHMQSAVRKPRPAGRVELFGIGWDVSQCDTSAVRSSTSRTGHHYKDGRFRETTFIVEAFMRSACYRKGQAQCGNCHNPHPADAASNPTSLKYPGPARPDVPAVSRRLRRQASRRIPTTPASSEASRCVACHMPRIMNSLLFLARIAPD